MFSFLGGSKIISYHSLVFRKFHVHRYSFFFGKNLTDILMVNFIVFILYYIVFHCIIVIKVNKFCEMGIFN